MPSTAPDDGTALDWAAMRSAAAGWLGRLTGSDRAAVGVVLVHLVPVAWLVVGGGLYLDDLRAQAYARGRSLWPFVVESNGTHLAPGARLVDWLQATYWPLQQWPATVLTLALHVALGAALWLLLRELVGPRPGAVVVLALGLLTPALVPMTAWFRQVLTTGSVLVCALLAVLAAVRFARDPGTRRLLLVVLPVAVGLLFSERALAAAAVAVATVVLLPTGRPLRRRVRFAVPLAVALGLLSAGYLAVYGRGDYDGGHTVGLTVADAGRLVWRAVVTGVVPALLGGPLAWRDSGPAFSVGGARPAFVVGAWVVVLLGALLAARRGGWRARVAGPALVALAYVLPVLAMVFVGRYAGFGPATGDDLRLYSDCAIALLVAAAVGVLGLRPATSGARSAARRSRPPNRTATAVVLVAVAVASVVSWNGFARQWHTNASPAYLSALDAGLDRVARFPASPPAVVMPTPVPDDVIPGWFEDELTTTDLVLLSHPGLQTSLADGPVLQVGPTGAVSTARPQTLGASSPPSSGYCGTSVPAAPAEPVTISLRDRVPYYRGMLLSVQVLTLSPTTLQLDVVSGDGGVHPASALVPATLDPGPHTLLVPVPFGADVGAVRVHPSSQHVCVPQVQVVAPRTGS
ncbi:hypothetical protein GCM10027446_19710 [Angustibacter peucedani]